MPAYELNHFAHISISMILLTSQLYTAVWSKHVPALDKCIVEIVELMNNILFVWGIPVSEKGKKYTFKMSGAS